MNGALQVFKTERAKRNVIKEINPTDELRSYDISKYHAN